MKFSLQMNIQDEFVRNNLTTLCFDLICKIEYSYADYEHLLKRKTQLLRGEDEMSDSPGFIQKILQACSNDEDLDSDIENILDSANIRRSGLARELDDTLNEQTN